VAIVAVDLCIAPLEMVRDWRRQVAQAIGTVEANVLINLSHSHSAPACPVRRRMFAFQADLIDGYYADVVPRIVERRAGECRAGTGTRARVTARVRSASTVVRMGPDGLIFLGEASRQGDRSGRGRGAGGRPRWPTNRDGCSATAATRSSLGKLQGRVA